MNSLLAMRALLFVGELFLGSTLAMNLAWLAAAAFPRRAALRHLIWLTGFGALLLLPLAALVIPSHVVLEHPALAASQSMAAAMPTAIPGADGVSNSDAIPDATSDTTPETTRVTNTDMAPPAMPAVLRAVTPAPHRATLFAMPNWNARLIAGIVLALWLAGVLVNALRGAVAAYGLRTLLRRSVPRALSALPLSEPVLAELAQTRCRLRLFTGNGPGPVTWGFVRPVILLPEDAVEWPQNRVQAVLGHELAHVRRHDSLVQALSLLICALYWPNPLVWLGARALRREAELAADDAVLASGITPSAYAGELVRLATEFRGRHLSFSGIAMAGQSALEDRVKSVLAPTPLRTGVTSMDAVKIACLALTATAALAMLRPDIAVAQSATPSPVTAAPLPPVPPAPAAQAAGAVPAAPAAPVAPPAPASLHNDGGNLPISQQQREIVRQAQREAQLAAAEAQREAEMAKRQADRDAAQAKREAELDAAEARREAEQDAAEAKREGEREGQMAAAEARREVQEQMVQVRAAQHNVEKAIADAHIDQSVARAMAEAQPQIEAAVAEAMKQVGPEIDKAMAGVQPKLQRAILQAKIGEVVARAMAKAQPEIDAAIANARRGQLQSDRPVDPKTKVKPMDE